MLLGLALGAVAPLLAQPTASAVFVVQIQDEIDLGLAPYLQRVIDEAETQQAAVLVLEINTPGGRLDAALQMRDALLDTSVPTIAFVNRKAFSAGALIALAAERIYMAPGAVMGAATPVDATGAAGDAKIISAVRSTFRSTAELRGRNPLLAEAMVDPTVTIPGLVGADQLLTLTTVQAQEHGYADGVAPDRPALLALLGLATAPLNVVRLLTNPLVASLLTSLGILLIMADVLSGGFGGLAGAGLVLLGLFFWGHMLTGLAGWKGVALVVVGLALVAVEIFVLPGFGLAGVLGDLALIVGLFISLVGGSVITSADLVRASMTIGATCVLVLFGILLLLRLVARSGRLRGLVLQEHVGSTPTDAPGAAADAVAGGHPSDLFPGPLERPVVAPTLLGLRGRALSDLRPAGLAEIAGRRVDVVSQGEYIAAGEQVEIIADEDYRRVVRRRPAVPEVLPGDVLTNVLVLATLAGREKDVTRLWQLAPQWTIGLVLALAELGLLAALRIQLTV